jgi:hypothetical protein
MDSTHHDRLAGVPEFFQVREHPVCASSAESRYVLSDDVNGLQFLDKPGKLSPETRPTTLDTGTFAREADVLTGEPAADDIHGNSICAEPGGGEFSNVIVAGDLRPVPRQHPPAERVDLAERLRLEATRPFEAEVKTADTRKE